MDISSAVTYIILPIVLSCLILFYNNSRTQANMLITKGVFYYILAFVTVINAMHGELLKENVAGFTTAIAIVEGSTAIKNAMQEYKKR